MAPETSPPRPERVGKYVGICRDGFPFVLATGFFTVAAYFFLSKFWAIGPGALTLFVLWFFRDPDRDIPIDPAAIVSPADGKVIDVRRVPYPRLLTGEATRVSIFMSVFNIHVNRIPCEGLIRRIDYNRGKFLAAFAEKASLENEQSAVVIDSDRGSAVMIVQIAGLIARRIVCRLIEGERVLKGERYGLIRFGSRMDVYLPSGTEPSVRVGDRVKGGASVLARFV